MSTVLYPIDWSVPYSPDCTRNTLRKHLREMASHWQGWENFPWYLTRTLHRHIDAPPGDWDHLHTRYWMTGYAADVLLNAKFENRNAVFDLLIRRQVQFPGIFRHMTLDQIYWCLVHRKQDRLPDCALWGADTPGKEKELDRKRVAFRAGIDQATSEFIRVLNCASMADDPARRIAGHPLKTWYKGAHLPAVEDVHVLVREEDGRVFLRPHPEASARFLSRRLPVPRIEVAPDVLPERAVEHEGHAEGVASAKGTGGEDAEDVARRTAIAAVEMATKLDDNPRLGCPTHCTVLGMYLRDNLTVREIAAKCKCSHPTVVNRKRRIETVIGMPLDALKVSPKVFAAAEAAVSDSRARRIHRKSLID